MCRHSEETKQKISESLRGKPKSAEHKLHLSQAKKGKKLNLTDEQHKHYSDIRKGDKNAFFEKHHSDETKKKIGEMMKGNLSPFSADFWIKKGLSVDEAEFKTKTFRKTNKEYWIIRGYTEEEAEIQISEFQQASSKKRAEKGVDPTKCSTRIEYYLNKGCTEEEAKLKLHERQCTFTLEKCIIKYGEVAGTKRYNDRQEKWLRKVFGSTTCISSGYSKVSQYFIESLLVLLPIDMRNSALYGKNEHFIVSDDGTHYKFDLTIGRKIIEYNSDFWHCNPIKYNEDYVHPVKRITAKMNWELDNIKNNVAIQNGYDILVVWESDYQNDKDKIINECLTFLTNNNEMYNKTIT